MSNIFGVEGFNYKPIEDYGVGEDRADGVATGSVRSGPSDSRYASDVHPDSAAGRGAERIITHVPA